MRTTMVPPALMRSSAGRRPPPPPPRSSNGLPSQQWDNGKKNISAKGVFITMILCALSFYSGLIVGMHGCGNDAKEGGESVLDVNAFIGGGKSSNNRFPASVKSWAVGMSRVNKEDFVSTFNMGLPIDSGVVKDNRDVLILYNHEKSLPNRKKDEAQGGAGEIPQLTPNEATRNCNTLKIMLTGLNDKKQCIALLGNWEDYFIQKWMRVPDKGPLDPKYPLRHVAKSYNQRGQPMRIPDSSTTKKLFTDILQSYYANLDHTLSSLKVLTSKVAVKNTVVVMIVNRGQAELLMNFVCNAKAKNLDTSQVLLFATDSESKDLAEGLGLTVFFDQTLFGNTSSQAASRYGDRHFTDMMLSKVYCVHLVNLLGYHVLFQDADVIWFKNPVDFFLEQISSKRSFDLYFQDDGARTPRYAPYSPNTGFYFIQHNERTQYFLSSLLRMADMIMTSGSHQSALNQVLSHHVSWRGLRVKVFPRTEDMFPGGFTFHRPNGGWMKEYFEGKRDPYIFHMSWTQNKNNKILFFQQMNEWYLNQPQCFGKKAEEIMFEATTTSTLEEACCSKEPLFSCHYRDKPSKFPCKDSPNLDNGKPSFW